jgi:DNA-binding transcriptional LysR family regulator
MGNYGWRVDDVRPSPGDGGLADGSARAAPKGPRESTPFAVPAERRTANARDRRALASGSAEPLHPRRHASLDDLQSMAVFARVVEAGSFTAAARELETTTSSVSKRIARMEEQLGVRLLVRTTRAVAPTEAGTLFHAHCARILRDVALAELAVTELGSTPRGTLRISALSVLGEGLLGPLLGEFALEQPDLRIELELSDRKVNLVEEGYDLALRGMQIGALPDSSLIARKLATTHTTVAAAPSYLARRGTPRAVEDLLLHDCLHYTGIPVHQEWSFKTPAGTVSVPVIPRIEVNSMLALRGAAIAGAGIVRSSRLAVADAVREGALVPVLEEFSLTDFGLYAVYPPGRQALPKVTAIVEFLARELPSRLSPQG